ncbi:MAG: site-specific integrase [Dehalococcoidales bacterium]|nr:site-specific integrase [Dehalococcoidales bacterium]
MNKAYLTPRDALAIERGAKTKRNALFIRLLFHLGCRISELLPLTVAQVDIENLTVEVRLLKQRLKSGCPHCQGKLSRRSKFCTNCGQPVTEAVKTATEELVMRRLPLDKSTIDMLQDYIQHERKKPGDRLFPFEYFHGYHIVTEAAKRAGVKDLTDPNTGKRRHPSPHRLRDAFATMAAHKNADPLSIRVLQERLGHKSIETTWKYVQVAGEEQKDWLDTMPFAEEEDEKNA